jgi:hypothetical protein
MLVHDVIAKAIPLWRIMHRGLRGLGGFWQGRVATITGGRRP